MSDGAAEDVVGSQVSHAWFGVTAGVLALGVVLSSPPLLSLGLLLSATLGLSWLWARYCLAGLSYERLVSQTRADWGEEIVLQLRVTNRKPLPLPWLEIEDEIPAELAFNCHLEPSPKPLRAMLEWRVALGWYERLTRRCTIRCTQRGEYAFGPVTVRSGDIFGLFTRTLTLPGDTGLLVYPRLVPLSAFGIPARQPFGDFRAVQPLVADPLRPQGVRLYAPGDNPRWIHWRASARLGELQTRLFEPAATPQVWIFCNQQTFARVWEGIDVGALELSIVVAASLARHALEAGYPTALETNAYAHESDQHVHLRPSTDREQLAHILVALARLQGWSGLPIELILERARHTLAWGASLVVITSVVSDWLLTLLVGLRRAGHPVTLIQVAALDERRGALPPTRPDCGPLGLTCYQVSGIGREAYSGLEELALA